MLEWECFELLVLKGGEAKGEGKRVCGGRRHADLLPPGSAELAEAQRQLILEHLPHRIKQTFSLRRERRRPERAQKTGQQLEHLRARARCLLAAEARRRL
eukprot:scaffold769_cov105-Isochrysis_galbana.AAC.4